MMPSKEKGATAKAVFREQLEEETAKGWRLHSVVSEMIPSYTRPAVTHYGRSEPVPETTEPAITRALFVLTREPGDAEAEARAVLAEAREANKAMNDLLDEHHRKQTTLEHQVAEANRKEAESSKYAVEMRDAAQTSMRAEKNARGALTVAEEKIAKIARALGAERIREIVGE